MGKIIDITNRLSYEPTFLVIGNESYKVDDRKNTVIEIMQILETNNNGLEVMDEVFKKALGIDNFNKINEQGISFADYQIYFIAIMAALMNLTYEEAEKRFQDSK